MVSHSNTYVCPLPDSVSAPWPCTSCDYVTFTKEEGTGETFGDARYSGSSFPGMGGLPPLEIKSSSFYLCVR
jgi:hypothetical protein